MKDPDWLKNEKTLPAQKFETTIKGEIPKVEEVKNEHFVDPVDPRKFSREKLIRVTKLVL